MQNYRFKQFNQCHSPKAFTIVELMTVVCIIAILVALLLPAANKARQAAQAIQCSANMGQIGRAVMQFASTHDGRGPGGGTSVPISGGGSIAWQSVLGVSVFNNKDYIPRTSVTSKSRLICPFQAMYAPISSGRVFQLNGSVCAADYVYPNPESMHYEYQALIGGGHTLSDWHLGMKLNVFKNPSSKYMITETDGGNDVINPTTPLLLSGVALGLYPWDAGTDPLAPYARAMWSFRHPNMKMNVVFMDGHVEPITYDQNIAHPNFVTPSY